MTKQLKYKDKTASCYTKDEVLSFNRLNFKENYVPIADENNNLTKSGILINRNNKKYNLASQLSSTNILILPKDCSDYMSLNYQDTYQTMTELPIEMKTADYNSVVNMTFMFADCIQLITIPKLNTKNVTVMDSTFYCCTSLYSIMGLDTSNVTIMNDCFSNCENLVDLPLLDTNNVVNTVSMFENCFRLTSISQLSLINVLHTSNMFKGCINLMTIPELNTSNVINMSGMFKDCRSLQSVNLDLTSCKFIDNLFTGCNLNHNNVRLKNVPSSLDLSNIGIPIANDMIVNYI